MSDAADATRTNPGAAKHLAEGRVLAGRFRLGEILGAGGMGVVYAAHDEQLDQPVAVKLLRSELASADLEERFRREIVLARKVSHPHVVRIHDVFRDGDLPFLTMDLVRGRSLREVIDAEAPLALPRAVRIVRQLAEALQAAHAEGVLHRDLKPDNVLVEGEGEGERVRISDFGIARSLDEAATGLTAPGAVVGTLDYLSPEQAAGDPLDGRSDLYSLGLIFHEMLSGSLPFRRGTQAEMLAQRLGTSPSLAGLSDVPLRWRRVVARLTQRDRDRRTPDAASLIRSLDGGGETLLGESARLPGRSRRALAIGVVIAVLLALGAAAWLWSGRGREAAVGPAESSAAAPAAGAELAVLPFVDRTGAPELAWVSRGGAELLAEALASRPGLRVVDPLRVFRLVEDLGLDRDALTRAQRDELASLLDVDRLVGATVRREGGELRFDVTLAGAGARASGERLLELTETSAPDAVGGALQRAAGALASKLDLDGAGPAETPPTDESVSAAARSAYDRGVESLVRGDPIAALEALRAATDASPDFVGAWIRASDAELALGRREEAGRTIRRAAEISGDSGGRRALEIAARVATLRGDAEEAAARWKQLAEAFPGDVEARLRLAETLGESGNLSEARRLLREIVEVDSRHPRAWFLLSKFAIQAGDLEEAVEETLVHALVIQNQLDNDPGRADVLNAMGVAYDRLGRLDLARERYAEAAELRRSIGDSRGHAASLRNLGAVATVLGDHAEADRLYDQAAEVLAELGDREGLASLASRRGLLAEERGQIRVALELYREALQIRRDLGDGRALGETYNHVGFAYFLLGEYDDAQVYWNQALDEVESSGNRQGEVFVRQSLGLLALTRGRWNEATEIFVESLAVGRDLGLPDVRAVALGYLARIAQLRGRATAALESNAEALALVEELGDPRGLGEFSLLRAETLLDVGAFDEAAAAVAAARESLETVGNDDPLARSDALEARVALAVGDQGRATERAASAADRAAGIESVEAVWEAGWTRALVALAAGDADGAASGLRDLESRAERWGHAVFRLRAALGLGQAELAAGRAGAAAEAFARGLAVLPAGEESVHRFPLHLGLAAAREALGDEAGARRALDGARAEVERLRAALDPPYRERFDAKPEVTGLAG